MPRLVARRLFIARAVVPAVIALPQAIATCGSIRWIEAIPAGRRRNPDLSMKLTAAVTKTSLSAALIRRYRPSFAAA
jgi:hypothetical protein